MDIEVLQIIIGLIVTAVCLGAVPFAINVSKSLATINATLKAMNWQETAIYQLKDDMNDLKVELAKLGGESK